MKWFAAIIAFALYQGEFARPPQQSRVTGIKAGYTIEPESVRVGDPATLKVTVRTPLGTNVFFPPQVDSTEAVEPLDPVSVQSSEKNGMLEWIGTYRFLAWEVGMPPISVPPIRVEQNGNSTELNIGDARVFVMSVLPADTAQRKPKPSRSIVFLPAERWPLFVLVAVFLFVAVLTGLWLQRRANRPPPALDPFAEAQRAFNGLNALDLIGAGEPARHVGASADILRTYIASRANGKGLGLTTGELVASLENDESVPVERVSKLLTQADDIKFAGSAATPANAEWMGAEAAALVAEIFRIDTARARLAKKGTKKKK